MSDTKIAKRQETIAITENFTRKGARGEHNLQKDVLHGPIIETVSERTITHPEHGNVVLPPGIYEITYQQAYAEELRRVAD